ncbi:TadE/TadG family type IV pilus assembly protein [Aquisalinus flavus]|uniref:Putative Flp pilus-assembly TadG-like N-terminal domain-containing protein n=1 Tax=Aquisalinus flavus TaxID=1526572 RepID=A0A8J2Y5V1_9PROT|nr:TadE/TadG family type IV pilus assembly protein [Aquisalinus flavus]MBD0427575.1 Tad domain-containing protein [Aquisalinus flavus]UNE47367.1 hypothetical protein FF099_04465 [Aquisalinus flavus]GGD02072.1 hypothetical protein GCM10011342_08880 [Aquisalinus flavus]
MNTIRYRLDGTAFGRSVAGNISILTSLLILPLIGFAGLAVDGARVQLVKFELQSATDAAALAVGTTFGTSDELNKLATDYIHRNFQLGNTKINKINTTSTAEKVTVTSSATMTPFFVQMVYKKPITISVRTDVNRAGGGLMVSLVLDNTGSMWGGLNGTTRLEALRKASLSMTHSLYASGKEEELRVSVVPYAAMVNPGDIAPSIVDMTNTADLTPGNPKGYASVPTADLKPLEYDPSDKTQWKGCVYERDGAASIDDTPPSVQKWKPLIWPIVDDNRYDVRKNGSKSGEPDPSTIEPGGNKNSNHFYGPNTGCPTPILPLTGKKAEVITALNAMTAWNRGGTFADIGMAWGIRTLTPGEPFTEAGEYKDPKTGVVIWDSPRWRRAIVLMTDGDNTVFNAGNAGDWVKAGGETSDITGYGRLGEAKMNALLGTSNSGKAKTAVEERLLALCTAAKAQGITIYTVVFSTSPNASTKSLYENCASDPGKYWFAPSASALDDAFGAIGSDLNKLRITR